MKTVLPLYEDLPTPEEMRQWDEAAHGIFGIPPLLLMENAAQEAARELKRHVALTENSTILIFIGKGNNGGDGAALARILYDEGCMVLVCPTVPLSKLRGPAREHMTMARKVGVTILPGQSKGIPVLPLDWRYPDVVVDAVAGTGLHGDLREKERGFVRIINSFYERSFVFSLDTPSGLCGYTGRPRPESVRAHATVCFEAGKPGLFFPEAQEYTGTITVRRVGIPLGVRALALPSWNLLAPKKGLFPAPSPFRHKGEAGKVLIIGGSEGMAGAPLLAALGCLRGGAGLVHVAFPGGLESSSNELPEALKHPVGTDRVWRREYAPTVVELMRSLRPDALVIGPGMGRTPAVKNILHTLLAEKDRPPFLLDADALSFFRVPEQKTNGVQPVDAANQEDTFLNLGLLRKHDILTPHPGEMARMLPPSFFPSSEEYTGYPSSPRDRIHELQANRPYALAFFTTACAAVLILKGPGTLIGRRGSPTTLSPIAVPTLAVGGAGDVLSGACGALMAHGFDSLDAACLGVHLHGRAGELLAERAPLGHLARDIADALPLAWMELCKE